MNGAGSGGFVYRDTFRGVSEWISRPFQAAAGIGVAKVDVCLVGGFPPGDAGGLLSLEKVRYRPMDALASVTPQWARR